jgi:hypothetical protein
LNFENTWNENAQKSLWETPVISYVMFDISVFDSVSMDHDRLITSMTDLLLTISHTKIANTVKPLSHIIMTLDAAWSLIGSGTGWVVPQVRISCLHVQDVWWFLTNLSWSVHWIEQAPQESG